MAASCVWEVGFPFHQKGGIESYAFPNVSSLLYVKEIYMYTLPLTWFFRQNYIGYIW